MIAHATADVALGFYTARCSQQPMAALRTSIPLYAGGAQFAAIVYDNKVKQCAATRRIRWKVAPARRSRIYIVNATRHRTHYGKT